MFMLCVGAMTGVWNMYGTCTGANKDWTCLIHPVYFLLAAFLLCILYTFVTGTAFGTCGTVGTAHMGIGSSFTFSLSSVLLCGMLEREWLLM